jgi:hypothetical protein
VRTKFRKSMLLTWTTVAYSRVGKPSDLFVYTPEGKRMYIQKKNNGTTILERGLPICGLRPNHVSE